MVDAWDHPLLKRLDTIQRKLHNMEKGAQNRITLLDVLYKCRFIQYVLNVANLRKIGTK